MHPKDADRLANSKDPDRTAPLFAQTYLSENFGSLRYCLRMIIQLWKPTVETWALRTNTISNITVGKFVARLQEKNNNKKMVWFVVFSIEMWTDITVNHRGA